LAGPDLDKNKQNYKMSKSGLADAGPAGHFWPFETFQMARQRLKKIYFNRFYVDFLLNEYSFLSMLNLFKANYKVCQIHFS
jgi:hypothetical protein